MGKKGRERDSERERERERAGKNKIKKERRKEGRKEKKGSKKARKRESKKARQQERGRKRGKIERERERSGKTLACFMASAAVHYESWGLSCSCVSARSRCHLGLDDAGFLQEDPPKSGGIKVEEGAEENRAPNFRAAASSVSRAVRCAASCQVKPASKEEVEAPSGKSL